MHSADRALLVAQSERTIAQMLRSCRRPSIRAYCRRTTLVPHPDLLQDPRRLRIFDGVHRLDTIQVQVLE